MVIGIDLGTTGCRAVAYSAGGRRLAMHHVEYGLTHPEPGAAEQEAEGWWSAVRACVQAVMGQVEEGCQPVGLSVSAQGHSWVPTNTQFRPLRPALTWLDNRASSIASELLHSKGTRFWGRVAGKAPGPWHTLPQILWLRKHEPEIEEAAAYYLFAHDFLIARLTGRLATDFTTAAASLLFNIDDFAWDRAIATEYRVDLDRFAGPHAAGTIAGPLGYDQARELGLPPGIPVAVGAQDQKCAALGAGLAHGIATASLGTATAITALSRRPTFDEAAAIPCFPYLAKGTWVLEAPLTTTGAALRWLRDLARGFGSADLDYSALDNLAAASPVGSKGVRFLPFLAGAGAPHWMPGARACLAGLGLDTSPGDCTRAVLESVAFEILTNLETMASQGVLVDQLRVFGGGARSDLWCQIIADVIRVPVERCADVETAATGAGIFALVAAGVYKDFAEGQEVLGGARQWFEPADGEPYAAEYANYRALRDSFWRLEWMTGQ